MDMDASVGGVETVPATPAEAYPSRLERSDVVNHILSLFHEPSYLEIGVNSGDTFFAVNAAHKVAVDPAFLFDMEMARTKHANALFHPVESDVYFGEIVPPGQRFDVIYLDGLHTFEQTLRDFCNAVEFLKPYGVIVIDDVVPNSYHASLPDIMTSLKLRNWVGSTDQSWMGDVYRLVFFIQSFFQQYRHATVVENHGQLVVWKDRRRPADVAHRRVEEIGSLPFENIVTDTDTYHRRSFAEIMSLLRQRN